MSNAQLLSGVDLAATINADTASRAARVTDVSGLPPTLATVLVGDDPASVTYVSMKQRRCQQFGLGAVHVGLPASIGTAEIVERVEELSNNTGVDGILVQHPMGEYVDERAVFDAITATKDVDGVSSTSFAAMALGQPGFQSCTPGGVVRLLEHHGVVVAGADVVVVGRSAILGKPLAALLSGRDATVTLCHSRTRNLAAHLSRADIVIAAVGRPRFINGTHLKDGAVVVDAGYHPGGVGDVDFASAARVAAAITPVPGGVGPMTIAMLLSQTDDAAETRVQQAGPATG